MQTYKVLNEEHYILTNNLHYQKGSTAGTLMKELTNKSQKKTMLNDFLKWQKETASTSHRADNSMQQQCALITTLTLSINWFWVKNITLQTYHVLTDSPRKTNTPFICLLGLFKMSCVGSAWVDRVNCITQASRHSLSINMTNTSNHVQNVFHHPSSSTI